MSKTVTDAIERTDDYCQFIERLKEFHKSKGTTLYTEPILGGKKIDLFKLYNSVVAAGGFNQVTKKRNWKQIGNGFDFPHTCTNSAYILKGVYIRNLLGWEEENVWHRKWVPPEELKGPKAHKTSTLAGKSYKPRMQKSQQQQQQKADRMAAYEPLILPNNLITEHQNPFGSTPLLPFNLITNTEQHDCAISERHHRVRPSQHIHSINGSDGDIDCVKATQFDERARVQIIPALQSDNVTDMEVALNSIVTISYEVPEKILLTKNPRLLYTLIEIADTCLQDILFEGVPASSAHFKPRDPKMTLLKILHILRNFSFIDSNARVFAASNPMRQMLVRCLVTPSTAHYSHCIDILENITSFIVLCPFDCIIGCLNHLVTNLTDRSVILGSIRILTLLAHQSKENFQFLLPTSTQITNKIIQLLMVQDEQLVGTCLEYLYQYSQHSVSFGQHLLCLHHGADLGILLSFLMAPCKYFKPLLPFDLVDGEQQQQQQQQQQQSLDCANGGNFMNEQQQKETYQQHGNVPCVPNLEAYQTLDEPYRCLGWLKDRFELAGPSNVLSLDDMYLLYETRFGHEKALRINDFYTVLKIAFPIVMDFSGGNQTSMDGIKNILFQNSRGNGARLEGITISGLQIKMSILHDGAELMCQWDNCSERFRDEKLLQNHIINDHITLDASNGQASASCQWTDCRPGSTFQDQRELSSHIRASHIELKASPQPQQQQSGNGSVDSSGKPFVDYSDIQGIALLSAQLLKVLSRSALDSHILFVPYERELLMMKRKRPKLAPFIDAIFSNFHASSATSASSSPRHTSFF